MADSSITSIHGDQIAEIHDVPMGMATLFLWFDCYSLKYFSVIVALTEVIIRPFPLDLNHEKVDSLIETLKVMHTLFYNVLDSFCNLRIFSSHLFYNLQGASWN